MKRPMEQRPMSRRERQAMEERRQARMEKARQSSELAHGPVDLPFLVLVILLTGIGLVMLLSASFPSAYYETDSTNTSRMTDTNSSGLAKRRNH